MSKSAFRMAEKHRQMADVYDRVADQFPDATYERMGSLHAIHTKLPVAHDRIICDGNRLIPCGTLGAGEMHVLVLSDGCGKRPIKDALQYMREKHPDAYAELIEWLVKG
jgi:hypothetical protein